LLTTKTTKNQMSGNITYKIGGGGDGCAEDAPVSFNTPPVQVCQPVLQRSPSVGKRGANGCDTHPLTREDGDVNCPSLNQLINWCESKNIDQDMYKVLIDYKRQVNLLYTEGRFYLYGQLLTNPDIPITRSLLQKAIEAERKEAQEYGYTENLYEAGSINRAAKLFSDLMELLEMYYGANVSDLVPN